MATRRFEKDNRNPLRKSIAKKNSSKIFKQAPLYRMPAVQQFFKA
jgi:hypothetical protein